MPGTIKSMLLLAVFYGAILAAGPEKASAQVVTTYVPTGPVVNYVPQRVGLFGWRRAYRPVVSYPMVPVTSVAPVTVSRPVIVASPVIVSRPVISSPVVVSRPVISSPVVVASPIVESPTVTTYSPVTPATTIIVDPPVTTYYAPAFP